MKRVESGMTTLVRTLPVLVLVLSLSACAADKPKTVYLDTPARSSGDAAATAHLLRLDPPEHYCALDRKHFMDAIALQLVEKAVEGAAQVLTVWRDCTALADSRRGINDYSQPTIAITALVEQGAPIRPSIPRATLIEQVAMAYAVVQRNEALTDAIDEEVRRRFDSSVGPLAESLGQTAKLGETTDLGVKGQDENAAYIAMITRASVGDRRIEVGNIIAITELNGILTEIAFFADHESDPDLSKLLATARKIMADLVVANDLPSRIEI